MYKENNQLKIREQEILNIVYQKHVKNLPVAIISMVGKRRTGKSYMLNMFLRYLNTEDKDGYWADDNLLNEFRSAGGRKTVTEGLFIWSKPFVLKRNGKVGAGQSWKFGFGSAIAIANLLSKLIKF